MNEKYTDTLVQRVMKKVEELKLWQLRNDKDGFEVIYKDVLREVEELPESDRKYHALADVLMRGWWWIPGKENDALFGVWTIRESRERTETVASRAPIPLCLGLQDPEALLTWAFQGHGCGHGV